MRTGYEWPNSRRPPPGLATRTTLVVIRNAAMHPGVGQGKPAILVRGFTRS